MYKVTFAKNVWDGQSEDTASRFAVVSYSLNLSFAPFLGLRVILPGTGGVALKTVCWSSSGDTFLCDLDDRFIGLDDGSWDDFLSRLIECGWTAVGIIENEK